MTKCKIKPGSGHEPHLQPTSRAETAEMLCGNEIVEEALLSYIEQQSVRMSKNPAVNPPQLIARASGWWRSSLAYSRIGLETKLA